MSIKVASHILEKGKGARRLFDQVEAARQWAQMKANRRFKKGKSTKEAYKPGVTVLGLSAVSESIKEKVGFIVSRRSRRADAKQWGFAFAAHYNGEGPVRVAHDVNPHRQSVRWRNG